MSSIVTRILKQRKKKRDIKKKELRKSVWERRKRESERECKRKDGHMSMKVRMEESKDECMILDIDCIIRGL